MGEVLMVDDDARILKDNRQYFESRGYEVICAGTAGKAEEIICSVALDCVVPDIDLPDESGFALCARVREKTGLPIVFLSGYTEGRAASGACPLAAMTMSANRTILRSWSCG